MFLECTVSSKRTQEEEKSLLFWVKLEVKCVNNVPSLLEDYIKNPEYDGGVTLYNIQVQNFK